MVLKLFNDLAPNSILYVHGLHVCDAFVLIYEFAKLVFT